MCLPRRRPRIPSSSRRARGSRSAPARPPRSCRCWRMRRTPPIPTARHRWRRGVRGSSTRTADARGSARVLAEALAGVPDDPAALALLLLDEAVAPGSVGQALWRAGETAAGASATPMARLYRLAAGVAAALAGDDAAAVARASELVDGAAGRSARASARCCGRPRAARPAARPGRSSTRSAPPRAPPDAATTRSRWPSRRRSRRSATRGRRRRFARWRRGDSPPTRSERSRASSTCRGPGRRRRRQGLPAGLLSGPADEAAAAARTAVTDVADAARGGNWDDAVTSLRDSPPHEHAAGPMTLHAAALLAEGRSETVDGAVLEAAALATAGDDPDAMSLSGLARIAEGERQGGAAHERARARGDALCPGPGEDRGRGGRVEAGAARRRGRRRRARRRSAGGRRWPWIRPACRRRARCAGTRPGAAISPSPSTRPRPRRRACTFPSTGSARCCSRRRSPRRPRAARRAGVPHRRRAMALLRAVLRDRSVARRRVRAAAHAARGERAIRPALAEALAARIAVAANPFEVTSLRLARAELLAARSAIAPGARAELDAILQKQPEHPRALARLSDLLWDDEAWSDAGEVYLRRTTVEREPAALREIFLRLGHIYRERVPDARRAITAYERVHGIEPDNREALQALSELYLAEGDAKQALPVTERLVALEPDAKKRTAYRVRLGELLMRTGDLRRAGIELRRAVDGDPRNVAAVTALAQLLERAARRRRPARAARSHGGPAAPRRRARRARRRDAARAGRAARAARTAARRGRRRRSGQRASGAPRRARGRDDRSLGLRRPEIDERSFPPGLPPGIRQLMRLVGPHLRPSGGELAQQLARHGVTRADRAGRGEEPRPVFDGVGAELAAGDFDLYVKTAATASGPVPMRVEPGSPAAIIIGAPIVRMGARRGPVRGGAHAAPGGDPPGRAPRGAAGGGGRAAGRDHPPVRPRLSAPGRARGAGRGRVGAGRAADSRAR